ncbi:MAG: DUF134 domain-containing protein [Andreesenia angusta]|nr:DUF134 domain-containing protein [Andreesenia angusta]
MARPKKFRKVCAEPKYSIYVPKPRFYDTPEDMETVILTVEEFEVIRLIDNRNLDQFETAEKMEIARSTVQRMYKEAREKIADAMVNGKVLKIEGGQYRLCEDRFFVDVCPDCPARIKERKNQE